MNSLTQLSKILLDETMVNAWGARNLDKSDHDNMIRISNAFNVEVSYVKQLLGENNETL